MGILGLCSCILCIIISNIIQENYSSLLENIGTGCTIICSTISWFFFIYFWRRADKSSSPGITAEAEERLSAKEKEECISTGWKDHR